MKNLETEIAILNRVADKIETKISATHFVIEGRENAATARQFAKADKHASELKPRATEARNALESGNRQLATKAMLKGKRARNLFSAALYNAQRQAGPIDFSNREIVV